MLFRKIGQYIEEHLSSGSDKILVVEGARQVGKSFIIRAVGSRLFKHFVEVNMAEDAEGRGLFRNVHTTEEFYFALSIVAGDTLGTAGDTLVFIDEIQTYPQYLTLLKFLRQEGHFHYIASGSLLGIALRHTTSIPVGSIIRKQMYPLDFEEFLIANGVAPQALSVTLKGKYASRESLDEQLHAHLLSLFRRYLIVGGMPDAVNEYLQTRNIVKVREIQDAIRQMYCADATKYEHDSGRNLLIRRIYDMVPSQMENKKRRIVAKDIRGKEGDRFMRYGDEFEYLLSSGISIGVHAIANPRFPLVESARKNLLKLYLNDVGMLTARLYRNNVDAIISGGESVNIGAVYENAVAQELKAHGHELFYYDNRKKGEVDFIVDDYSRLSILPIEVKSGKDYAVHSALTNMLSTADYHVESALVLSNTRKIVTVGKKTYLPVYFAMFIGGNS